MMVHRTVFLAAVLPLLGIGAARAADRPHDAAAPQDSLLGVHLVPIATNLLKPVGITHAGDGSGRVFITLQDGKIVIWDGTQVLPTPFLNIDPIVNSTGQEQGLLGLAFHPDYENNGYFYVDYTDTTGGDTIIARYSVSAGNPDVADPASAVILMEIDQPFANHNGGQLQFGPDGFLYIGMGDGGSSGDPGNRAQDKAQLLGKILRIDVDAQFGLPPDCGGSHYTIPIGNPFVDGPGGNCDEVWHLGLRNPWRFSFDRLTGDLFIADVGQDVWEEIDRQPAGDGGKNWGWRCYEGNHPYNTQGCGPLADYDGPILEYSHSLGCAVIGGYVYRGSALPPIAQGTFIYGDYCSGRIWAARQLPSGSWASALLQDTAYSLSTFGETEAGELCFAHNPVIPLPNGKVVCALPSN